MDFLSQSLDQDKLEGEIEGHTHIPVLNGFFDREFLGPALELWKYIVGKKVAD